MNSNEIEQFKKTLQNKRSLRDNLLGKKSSLVDSLKELGFSSSKEAEKALVEMDEELEKMDVSLSSDVNVFKTTYGDLLK